MHTQTLLHRPLVTRSQEQASKPEALAPAGQAEWRASRHALLIGLTLLGACAVVVPVWALAGRVGFLATIALFAVAATCFTLFQSFSVTRSLSELRRLVTNVGQTENVNLAAFRLNGEWREIAQGIVSLSGLELRQRRESRQAGAAQKLELSQSVLQAALRRAEAIVHSLSDALLVTNSFGELSLANPEAERLLGFDLDKVRGKSIRQVISTPALVNLIEQVTGRGSNSGRHSGEISIVSGGKARWYKATTSPAVDCTTEQLGIVTVLRDITSERAAQARSAEFVSAVSHEIKTPLASVKAYAEMLADGDADGDPETQQKFLNIIETQTDRMTRLLDSLLDIARIESGVVRVEKKIVSLNEMIEGGAKLMKPAAADKGLTLDTRLSSMYLAVRVDPDMMNRVVMNLISNATKYTDPGGRIVLRSLIMDDRAAFEVEDTGRGIPADALPKLFQKFYRVKENEDAAPGTGLGLSLVKHIVEEVHGGKVEVESEPGKGSIFRVKLPLEGMQ